MGAVDVGLGEGERRRVTNESDEGLGLVNDGRAHGRAATEVHDRSVPEAEGKAAGNSVEDTVQHLRGAPRTDVLGKDHLIPGPPSKTGFGFAPG